MIEVIPAGSRWTYHFICDAGRVLVYTAETFPCPASAFAAAKAYRSAFWAMADAVDYRMGRCI